MPANGPTIRRVSSTTSLVCMSSQNSRVHLTATLECIVAGHPQNRIDALMPWASASP